MTLMPCGLKVPFGKSLAAFISDLPDDVQRALNYAVESNVNHELSYYPYVGHIQSVDELPDVIVSSDFNDFFHRRFYERFVRPKTNFADLADYAPNALFTDAGVPDPLGQYIILCVNPLIVVADLEKAGDRPLPRRREERVHETGHRGRTSVFGEDVLDSSDDSVFYYTFPGLGHLECRSRIRRHVFRTLLLDDQVFFVIPSKASNPCASGNILDSGSPLRCARNDGRLGPVGGKNLITEYYELPDFSLDGYDISASLAITAGGQPVPEPTTNVLMFPVIIGLVLFRNKLKIA